MRRKRRLRGERGEGSPRRRIGEGGDRGRRIRDEKKKRKGNEMRGRGGSEENDNDEFKSV